MSDRTYSQSAPNSTRSTPRAGPFATGASSHLGSASASTGSGFPRRAISICFLLFASLVLATVTRQVIVSLTSSRDVAVSPASDGRPVMVAIPEDNGEELNPPLPSSSLDDARSTRNQQDTPQASGPTRTESPTAADGSGTNKSGGVWSLLPRFLNPYDGTQLSLRSVAVLICCHVWLKVFGLFLSLSLSLFLFSTVRVLVTGKTLIESTERMERYSFF
jgi:hypothetical protein